LSASAVIDAAVAVHAAVDGPRLEPCLTLLRRLALDDVRLTAPALWSFEVASAFSKLVYFGELSGEEADAALEGCQALGVELSNPDLEDQRAALAWSRRLGRASAYDSFYLALAERLGCDLWTTDLKLVRAVDLPWVRAVPESGEAG